MKIDIILVEWGRGGELALAACAAYHSNKQLWFRYQIICNETCFCLILAAGMIVRIHCNLFYRCILCAKLTHCWFTLWWLIHAIIRQFSLSLLIFVAYKLRSAQAFSLSLPLSFYKAYISWRWRKHVINLCSLYWLFDSTLLRWSCARPRMEVCMYNVYKTICIHNGESTLHV